VRLCVVLIDRATSEVARVHAPTDGLSVRPSVSRAHQLVVDGINNISVRHGGRGVLYRTDRSVCHVARRCRS